MDHYRNFILNLLLLLFITSCAGTVVTNNEIKEIDANYLELKKINDDVWIHISYDEYNGNRYPSNGLVVITSVGPVLIDTPWTNPQTEELIKLVRSKFGHDFKMAIVTHAHKDRIGGIDSLLDKGINVQSTPLTAIEARKNKFKEPTPAFTEINSTIEIGNTKFEIFYPGPGHSPDNIIVWLPQYQILFGGCLVKSLDAKSKGNTGDADLVQWPLSLKKVLQKYPSAKMVIPGHGLPGGIELIEHTLEVIK